MKERSKDADGALQVSVVDRKLMYQPDSVRFEDLIRFLINENSPFPITFQGNQTGGIRCAIRFQEATAMARENTGRKPLVTADLQAQAGPPIADPGADRADGTHRAAAERQRHEAAYSRTAARYVYPKFCTAHRISEDMFSK
jgi:hypothetical protein